MVGSRKPFVISPRVLESYHLKKYPAYLHPGVEETILDPTHVNTKLNNAKYIYIYISLNYAWKWMQVCWNMIKKNEKETWWALENHS